MKEGENELVDDRGIKFGHECFQVCAGTAKIESFEIKKRYAIERGYTAREAQLTGRRQKPDVEVLQLGHISKVHEEFSWEEMWRIRDAVEDEAGETGGGKQEGRQGGGEEPDHHERTQPR